MIKEKQIVMGIYILFLIALITNFIPLKLLQLAGGISIIVAIVSTYIHRFRSKKGDYKHSHMSFLIRTFWASTLLLIAGMAAALFLADHTIIYDTVRTIEEGTTLSEQEIMATLHQYYLKNFWVFALTIGPCLIYMAYRLVKGMITANKGLPIEKVSSWL